MYLSLPLSPPFIHGLWWEFINLNFIRINELRFMGGLVHVKALLQPKLFCDSKIKEAVIGLEYYKTKKQNLMMLTNKKKFSQLNFVKSHNKHFTKKSDKGRLKTRNTSKSSKTSHADGRRHKDVYLLTS